MGAKTYFFKGDRYVRYDIASDTVDDGYPLAIADHWPGMREASFGASIDAAVDWGNGKAFFFKADKYLRYDITADKVDDGYPLAIADHWPGIREAGFGASIDAVVNWGNGKAYFFKGDKYLRYDTTADKADDGYPLAIADHWPGMREAGFGASVDAVVNWGNGKAFVFKDDKYLRYDMAHDRVDDGYPLMVGALWPGMASAGFAVGVKAALSLSGRGRAAALTADLSEGFFTRLAAMCGRLGCHPVQLALVMYSESGLRASALNPSGKAAGINQLVPDTLRGLGWPHGPEAFAGLDAEAQLPWVEKFYAPHRPLGLTSIGRLYQLNFLPATAAPDQDSSTVLAERGGVHGRAYADNAILDHDHDGRITLGDLAATALSRRAEARWKEIEGRF
jgi:hypothetical protein